MLTTRLFPFISFLLLLCGSCIRFVGGKRSAYISVKEDADEKEFGRTSSSFGIQRNVGFMQDVIFSGGDTDVVLIDGCQCLCHCSEVEEEEEEEGGNDIDEEDCPCYCECQDDEDEKDPMHDKNYLSWKRNRLVSREQRATTNSRRNGRRHHHPIDYGQVSTEEQRRAAEQEAQRYFYDQVRNLQIASMRSEFPSPVPDSPTPTLVVSLEPTPIREQTPEPTQPPTPTPVTPTPEPTQPPTPTPVSPTPEPTQPPTPTPVSPAPTPEPTQPPTPTPVTPAPTPEPTQPPTPAPVTPAPTPEPSTANPSDEPTPVPTPVTSNRPSRTPSGMPSIIPSGAPSESTSPSGSPSRSSIPSASERPSFGPSTTPTRLPTGEPSFSPSLTTRPTRTQPPSEEPTMEIPTSAPNVNMTTPRPTPAPSPYPSMYPTECIEWWSSMPSISTFPSLEPSESHEPSISSFPSLVPTLSSEPSLTPSSGPSDLPSSSMQPSLTPSIIPSSDPTASTVPSLDPSSFPSSLPSLSHQPSTSTVPSLFPSFSVQPSDRPSNLPTMVCPPRPPSFEPSSFPSTLPSWFPSEIPSTAPSGGPSNQPITSEPTRSPETLSPTSTPFIDIKTPKPIASRCTPAPTFVPTPPTQPEYSGKGKGKGGRSRRRQLLVEVPAAETRSKTSVKNQRNQRVLSEGKQREGQAQGDRHFDFVLDGFPECGLDKLQQLLIRHKEIAMSTWSDQEEREPRKKHQCAVADFRLPEHQVQRLLDETYEQLAKNGTVANATAAGGSIKFGFQCPYGIYSFKSIARMEEHSPNAKFIVGLRHPIEMLERMYNHRLQAVFYEKAVSEAAQEDDLWIPTFEQVMASSVPWKGISMASVRYELFLLQLGKTVVTEEEMHDLDTTGPDGQWLLIRPNNFSVFFYTMDQLYDTNATRYESFLSSLQSYLGLSSAFEFKAEQNGALATTRSPDEDYEILGKQHEELIVDICSSQYKSLRTKLLEQSKATAEWVRDRLTEHTTTANDDDGEAEDADGSVGTVKDIWIANPAHFVETLQGWSDDPCEK